MMNWGRLHTAMVTPFDEAGQIDYRVVERLVDHLIETGSDVILVHGTTGESPTLTHEEEYALYRAVKKAAGGRAKVMAGTGSNSTETAIRSTQEAEKIGVDAILLVVPYYNKPSQEGLFQHFKKVAASTALPIMLYNIPGRTGVNMLPETIARVAAIPNIVAVKEAAGSVSQAAEIREKTPSDFLIYSGDDGLTLPMLSVGACGVVSVASHLAGREIKKMIEAYFRGEVQEAARLHHLLSPLFDILFMTTNPIPLKAALRLLGFPVGLPRLPLVDLNPAELKRLKETLESLPYVTRFPEKVRS